MLRNKMILKNLSKRSFFSPKTQLRMTSDVEELPAENTNSGELSSRTHTKWFNPNHFDPRSIDYIDTVRCDWKLDAEEEDNGESAFLNSSEEFL